MIKRNENKVKLLLGLCLVLIFMTMSGCKHSEKIVTNNYYLALSGESETWKVKSYQLKFTPKEFSAGNGRLIMKKPVNPIMDKLNIEVYAVIDNVKTVIQTLDLNGSGFDISNLTTGTVKGGTYLNKNKKPIILSDISDIYMIVEWNNKDNNMKMKERIDLFNKDNFLN
ncbi:hypothetical protein [Bacillus sp. AFS017336]|uniref:hypothetical protein n=1 Tax=Bacillus sp. AFS017336 TaxID=2033489 RepID=UPI000BEFE7DA|nr:hypothetical protein [Bacillus sp. AFS017336]PEL13984.1 hypothetical protein CN601_02750 [Bacillus sp. AFS017336]